MIELMYEDLKKIVNPRQSTYNFLNKYFPTGKYVELGVSAGNNLQAMSIACVNATIYGVDVFEDVGIITVTDGIGNATFDVYYKNAIEFASIHKNVNIIKGFTYDIVNDFDDESIDFLYIDADHSYNGIKTDINDWYKKVKKGGIISGHDYFEHTSAYKFGVVQAINEFNSEHNVNYFHVTPESFAPSWYMIRNF